MLSVAPTSRLAGRLKRCQWAKTVVVQWVDFGGVRIMTLFTARYTARSHVYRFGNLPCCYPAVPPALCHPQGHAGGLCAVLHRCNPLCVRVGKLLHPRAHPSAWHAFVCYHIKEGKKRGGEGEKGWLSPLALTHIHTHLYKFTHAWTRGRGQLKQISI